MSLKHRMLGIDRQHGRFRQVEPGADPGISRSQPRGLLNKLLIEQTKSRPRHSDDNGLAETKNAWVIRKHIGWGHIASQHAEPFDQFYRSTSIRI